MTLIVIEGIDGSGKGTQAQSLLERFAHYNMTCRLFSFPRYSKTRFGKLVGDYLNGRLGRLQDIPPQLACLPYALDRWESREDLLVALGVFDVVVCDRYVPSNVAHQCARLNEHEGGELAQWINQTEHGLLRLPVPDLIIHLDISVERAMELIALKKQREYTDKKADLHEANKEYLESVRSWYNFMSGHRVLCDRRVWKTVSVEDDRGQIRPIEEVSSDVWKCVETAQLVRSPN